MSLQHNLPNHHSPRATRHAPLAPAIHHPPPRITYHHVHRQALDATECTVVSGPEVLNKFVGTSEERIRGLFSRAEGWFGVSPRRYTRSQRTRSQLNTLDPSFSSPPQLTPPTRPPCRRLGVERRGEWVACNHTRRARCHLPKAREPLRRHVGHPRQCGEPAAGQGANQPYGARVSWG